MKCVVSTRVWAVAKGLGGSLTEPYNVTDMEAVEEVRDFIQRALAAKSPSDIYQSPRFSAKEVVENRYVLTISLSRLPRLHRQRKLLRPPMVVKQVADDLWEVDFE